MNKENESLSYPKINTSSLFYGHAGMAIAYSLVAKHENSSLYKDKAAACLECISEEIALVQKDDFENGLAGIGWAIEWLIQNGLLTVDTNEILEDLDDVLYKSTVNGKDGVISLRNGALGKAAYFHKRVLNKIFMSIRYKNICHRECLTMLTDDIDETLKSEGGFVGHLPALSDLASILLLFSKIFKINEPTVEDVFYEAAKTAEGILEEFCAEGEKDFIESDISYRYTVSYLSLCYLIVSRKNKHYFWEEKAVKYVSSIFNSYENTEPATSRNIVTELSLFGLLNIYCPTKFSKEYTERLLKRIDRSSLPCTLYQGLGTVMLVEASLGNPSLTDSWEELLFI